MQVFKINCSEYRITPVLLQSLLLDYFRKLGTGFFAIEVEESNIAKDEIETVSNAITTIGKEKINGK